MKPMRVALVSAAALAVFSASAHADGVPRPYSAPVVLTPSSWTGFYAGVNGGYTAMAPQDRDIILQSSSGGGMLTLPGMDPQGAFGGGQFGYNWQSGPLVLGVEADIQGADIHDGFNVAGTAPGLGSGSLTGHQDIDWFGTVRGRVGFAFDRALIYGTGGFAYGGVKDELFGVSSVSGATVDLRREGTQTGFTVGGGVEYAIYPHWSLKIEYQFIDLGSSGTLSAADPSKTVAPPVKPGGPVPGGPVPGTIISINSIDNEFNTVRAGLNYRFGE